MRRNVFRDINSALDAEWIWNKKTLFSDNRRLFQFTRYFDKVFEDTRKTMPELPYFYDSYENDLFILLYSDVIPLNPNADWLKKRLTEDIKRCKSFFQLKPVCENRELFALVAAESVFQSLLNATIFKLSKNEPLKQYMDIIDALKAKINADMKYLLLEKTNIKKSNSKQQKQFLKVFNRMNDRMKQCDNLYSKMEDCYLKEQQIQQDIETAVQEALEQVNEIRHTLISWGNDSGTVGNVHFDAEILKRVKSEPKLRDISMLLGKYKEMLIDKRKNSFTYGEGEKYDLTAGNDINACLSSDLALLSTPQTQSLFLHKYMNGNLTQYRKREATTKAKGDIIVCIDGSSSMSEVIAWAMAIAFALWEIAKEDKRKFALIQFGNKNQIRIDEFIPETYTSKDGMDAASHFFNGGTNFERPLGEAMRLIETGYHDAEIAFITDGECMISDQFSKEFLEFRETHKLTVSGILIDDSDSNCGASLQPFCNRIYRSSTLDKNDIAADLIKRIDDGEAA